MEAKILMWPLGPFIVYCSPFLGNPDHVREMHRVTVQICVGREKKHEDVVEFRIKPKAAALLIANQLVDGFNNVDLTAGDIPLLADMVVTRIGRWLGIRGPVEGVIYVNDVLRQKREA